MSILHQMQPKAKAQARQELQQAANVDNPFLITAGWCPQSCLQHGVMLAGLLFSHKVAVHVLCS